MTGWRGCTGLAVSLLLLRFAIGASKSASGDDLAVFEATYKLGTYSEPSSKKFEDAFKPLLAPNERIEILAFKAVEPREREDRTGEQQEDRLHQEKDINRLKQRGRSLLQSADGFPGSPLSDSAAAAAALNPGASMQGTGKRPSVTMLDQVTLAPGQSIQERIGFGLQQHSSSNTQGIPGASLWDASVAAAQARGETVSLYASPAQTPQAPKLYTGFGLEQQPTQARPLTDSFLQIDRIEPPAPAAAPGAGDLSIRTLKQGDGEEPSHYWDSAQGRDLAAEAPLLDWVVAPSTAAMPAAGTPGTVRHYWGASEGASIGAPGPSREETPQGRNPHIFEHRWSMPNQAAGRVPADGTFPAQVFTASIPALALEHADISDPSSVPVRLNAKSGPVQAASVQDALSAAASGSSGDATGAVLGAPASSRRRLLIWQAGSEEVKDDAWAREGWDGDIQAAKAAEAEQEKALMQSASDQGKAASWGADADRGEIEVVDMDQKALVSQSADGTPARTGSGKGALENFADSGGGLAPKKQVPAKQPRGKAGGAAGKAGSRAGNAGSSASSVRLSAETAPRKWDGQKMAGAFGKKVGAQGGNPKSQASGQEPKRNVQGPGRPKGKGSGVAQDLDAGGTRTKASADVSQPAQRQSASGVGGEAAVQQLSQDDLNAVTSLLSIIRDNAGEGNGVGQLFKPKGMDYIHRAIVQAIADAKSEASPCKEPPKEEMPQDLVEMLTGYKQVPREKESKKEEEVVDTNTAWREYTITFRVTTPETKFGELLRNPNVLRIVKENLQKQKIQVTSVTDEELVRVMRDGSRWVMSKDEQQKQVVSNDQQAKQTRDTDSQQKQFKGNSKQQKLPQRGSRVGRASSRRLLADVLSAVPGQALPARLVSAIKAAAGFVHLRSL